MSNLLMRRSSLRDLPSPPALPTGYELREYHPDDLDATAAMMRRAFEDESWTPQRFTEALVGAPDVVKTYVVCDQNGLPVATASARLMPEQFPHSGYVHWVAVDPTHRGQQLGAVVTLAVLQEFVRQGCTDAVLETQDERLPAIRIYRKLGFEPEHSDVSHPERWAQVLSNLLAAANL